MQSERDTSVRGIVEWFEDTPEHAFGSRANLLRALSKVSAAIPLGVFEGHRVTMLQEAVLRALSIDKWPVIAEGWTEVLKFTGTQPDDIQEKFGLHCHAVGWYIRERASQSETNQGSFTSGNNEDSASHSDDFTSVKWYGAEYLFSKGNQAQSVKVLWEAWENGGHSLSQETIGEKIGSAAGRFELRTVFRQKQGGRYVKHPAWGTMIQPAGKGCFRLVSRESA